MTNDSPAVILYDGYGHPVGVVLEGLVYKLQAQVTGSAPDGYAIQGNPVLVAGSDGINTRILKTTNTGVLQVDATVNVDNIEVPDKAAYDIFNNLIIGFRNNQIETSFFQGVPSDHVDVTTTSTGYASRVGGQALFGTGNNANGTSKGITNLNVVYRPLHETYAAFSVGFTDGIANSNQRIGLYNDIDGFFVGFENTSFGITHRVNSVSTFISASNFSDDLLDGSVGSKFTRNAIPEAIDLTKSNVFIISFGWLGTAPIKFFVISPDGEWILFHTIKRPNLDINPSLTNPSLPIRAEVNKSGGDSTDLIIYTSCWAAGTTSNLAALNETITSSMLAILTRSIIVAQKPNGDFTKITANNNGRLLVSNDSVGETGIAVPTNATMAGGSDGTNLRALRTATDGTLRTDPTGTTTQPISAASLPLPTGAATEATLANVLTGTTFTNRINTLGQKTMANSTPVVFSSDQTTLPVLVDEIYKTLYDVGPTEIYIGTATVGTSSSAASWRIKKTTLDIDGNPVSILWSSNTAVWDNRTSESYS